MSDRIRTVVPPTTAGIEAVLQRAPQSPPRVAVRALSPHAELSEGPAVLLAAHSAAIDTMVQAFRKGLGLPDDWTVPAIKARCRKVEAGRG